MLKKIFGSLHLSAIAIAFSCLYSHSLFAENISARISGVPNQAMKQRIEFNQDVRLLEKGDTVSLPLASGQLTQFTVTSNKSTAKDANVISATSRLGADLLLSTDQKATYGSILGNGMKYTLDFDSTMGTILVDQNHPEFPEIDLGDDGIVPPNKSPNLPGIEQMTPKQQAALKSLQLGALQQRNSEEITANGSSIRILILYSNEFANGFTSPSARINQLLQFANQSMQNSGIDLEFTLALGQVLNFDNNLSTGTVLNQVQAGEGDFSGVASLRDQVGADLVAILSFQSGFSANGIAFVNGDNADFAFSATRLSPGCCDSVFAHELGHNMGSGHDHEPLGPGASNPCGFNFTGYSCGHGNSTAGWGTIMARSPLSSTSVNNVFSNPALNCLGEACGVPEGQTDAADNFRSFNMSRLLVAEFRPDPVVPPTNPSPPSTPSGILVTPSIYLLLDDD